MHFPSVQLWYWWILSVSGILHELSSVIELRYIGIQYSVLILRQPSTPRYRKRKEKWKWRQYLALVLLHERSLDLSTPTVWVDLGMHQSCTELAFTLCPKTTYDIAWRSFRFWSWQNSALHTLSACDIAWGSFIFQVFKKWLDCITEYMLISGITFICRFFLAPRSFNVHHSFSSFSVNTDIQPIERPWAFEN